LWKGFWRSIIAVRYLLDLTVFVTTRDEECLRRRLERDMAERGRTQESVLEQYYSTVWPMALQYVPAEPRARSLSGERREPLTNRRGDVASLANQTCGVGLVNGCGRLFRVPPSAKDF